MHSTILIDIEMEIAKGQGKSKLKRTFKNQRKL